MQQSSKCLRLSVSDFLASDEMPFKMCCCCCCFVWDSSHLLALNFHRLEKRIERHENKCEFHWKQKCFINKQLRIFSSFNNSKTQSKSLKVSPSEWLAHLFSRWCWLKIILHYIRDGMSYWKYTKLFQIACRKKFAEKVSLFYEIRKTLDRQRLSISSVYLWSNDLRSLVQFYLLVRDKLWAFSFSEGKVFARKAKKKSFLFSRSFNSRVVQFRVRMCSGRGKINNKQSEVSCHGGESLLDFAG